jgi:hypothetical protein
MAVELDSGIVLRAVEQCRHEAVNDRQRRMLDNLIRHMRAETVEPDLDALMATVSPDPNYHSWGSAPRDAAPKGRQAVHDFYRAFLEGVGHEVEFEVERMALGNDVLAMDGVVRRIFPGSGLPLGDAAGVSMEGREIDPDAYYLWETRMACFFSFDEHGLVCREDTYATGAPTETFRRLEPHEVPGALEHRR